MLKSRTGNEKFKHGILFGLTHASYRKEFLEAFYTELLILSIFIGLLMDSVASIGIILLSLLILQYFKKLTILITIVISISWAIISVMIGKIFLDYTISSYSIITLSSIIFVFSFTVHLNELEWPEISHKEQTMLKHTKNIAHIENKIKKIDNVFENDSKDKLFSIFSSLDEDVNDSIIQNSNVLDEGSDSLFNEYLQSIEPEYMDNQKPFSIEEWMEKSEPDDKNSNDDKIKPEKSKPLIHRAKKSGNTPAHERPPANAVQEKVSTDNESDAMPQEFHDEKSLAQQTPADTGESADKNSTQQRTDNTENEKTITNSIKDNAIKLTANKKKTTPDTPENASEGALTIPEPQSQSENKIINEEEIKKPDEPAMAAQKTKIEPIITEAEYNSQTSETLPENNIDESAQVNSSNYETSDSDSSTEADERQKNPE